MPFQPLILITRLFLICRDADDAFSAAICDIYMADADASAAISAPTLRHFFLPLSFFARRHHYHARCFVSRQDIYSAILFSRFFILITLMMSAISIDADITLIRWCCRWLFCFIDDAITPPLRATAAYYYYCLLLMRFIAYAAMLLSYDADMSDDCLSALLIIDTLERILLLLLPCCRCHYDYFFHIIFAGAPSCWCDTMPITLIMLYVYAALLLIFSLIFAFAICWLRYVITIIFMLPLFRYY